MLYVVMLEPFLHNLRAHPVLHGLSLSGNTIMARYSANAEEDAEVYL